MKASGPRGHITKEDLINYIEKNNLKKVAHHDVKSSQPAASSAAPSKQAKKPAAPKRQAKVEESPKFDANNPFQQTWVDTPVSGDLLTHKEDILTSKKYRAHTYLSTKFDTAALHSVFGNEVQVEPFIKKAIHKSF